MGETIPLRRSCARGLGRGVTGRTRQESGALDRPARAAAACVPAPDPEVDAHIAIPDDPDGGAIAGALHAIM
jgi:hypothetical protein